MQADLKPTHKNLFEYRRKDVGWMDILMILIFFNFF